MTTEFVHLHCHSEYSLIDGLLLVSDLSDRSLGLKAIAITDQTNLFGLVKFYQALQSAGVKLIVGADLYVDDFTITVLCQNNTGYQHLIQLISKAYLENQTLEKPIVKKEWLIERAEGLIILSGAQQGDVGKRLLQGQDPTEALLFWQTHFPGRYYVELQRVGRAQDEMYIQLALPLAERHQLPVVATNDVRFLKAEDFEAHEARVCIHQGSILNDPKRARLYTREQYVKSEKEMCALFADIPEALQNSVEIAKRCTVQLRLGETRFPDFVVPEGYTIESYLTHQAEKGLRERYPEAPTLYFERLQRELAVILQMGFAGYFLIVADFIGWAKCQRIPVGPGRGSGAGSIVAYALSITDLDPIAYDLLFERFLNPERVSLPDFDIDFCMDNRDRVIEYVSSRYGRECVSQIITFGTMAARAVVRDVGRVMGLGYGYVDSIAKLIPFEIGITLDKALEQEEQLKSRYETEEDIRNLLDLAKRLEGVARNAGKHAGGVVIAPGRLTDFTPLYCEADGSNLVTQFDKDDIETMGLVKFDFLGLRTLTIIDWAIKIANDAIDIHRIPLDDEKTYALLKACHTTAVFQLESRGMKDLIKRLQPDCFEEIVALVALFRPGPLQSGMVDDFIDRKHGRAVLRYPHASIETILKPTYGVILYQEQVMQIAQVMAGYTLGSADILRRAMGKKKAEEMAQQREIFVRGAIQQGIDEKIATHVFDLMEKFAGYGFNKSHSAAYALLSYQTAWLKVHYPAAFMAAVLSSDMDNTDKVVIFLEECKRMQLTVLPPDIHRSHYHFTVNDKSEIVYGLGAIKGAGQAALDIIFAARDRGGKFADLGDFCKRIDLRKVNRRVLETLIKSGALDCFGERATLFAHIDAAMLAASQVSRDRDSGQYDLFSEMTPAIVYRETAPWSMAQVLAFEKESLGYYLSGHPLNRYEDELKKFVTARIGQLRKTPDKKTVIVAGMLMDMRTMQTKRGDRMAFLSVADRDARIEIAVFSEAYQRYRSLWVKDTVLVLEGSVSVDEYSGGYKMSAQRVWSLVQAREFFAGCLRVQLTEQDMQQGAVTQLQALLMPHRGGACPVDVVYQKEKAEACFRLGSEWCVAPTDALLDTICARFTAELLYKGQAVEALYVRETI